MVQLRCCSGARVDLEGLDWRSGDLRGILGLLVVTVFNDDEGRCSWTRRFLGLSFGGAACIAAVILDAIIDATMGIQLDTS